MFLEVTLKKHATVASYYPAENFVKEVELEIGGQRIDKLYSDWLNIHNELFRTGDEKLAYRRLVDFDKPAATEDAGVIKRFFVPLTFFFNTNPGLALPLIALETAARKSIRTLLSRLMLEVLMSNLDMTKLRGRRLPCHTVPRSTGNCVLAR